MKIKKLKFKKNSNNEYSDYYYFTPKNENIKCADGNSLESTIYNLKSKIDTLTNKTNDLIKSAPLVGIAEGINLNIEDSAESRIKRFGIYGNSKQEKTEGYQLLNISDHTLTSYGVTTTTKDNKINCSGTIDIDWANISASSAITCDLKANKTYTFVLNKALNYVLYFKYNSSIDIRIPAGSIYTTYTPTAEKTGLYYFIQAKEGTSISITDLQLMIYEGEYDENKTFELYTGGQPSPSPKYPQKIEVIDNYDTENKYNLPEGHIGLRQTNEDGSKEKIYAIDLAGNSIAKVGDVKDLLSISEKGEVELEKLTGKIVLDGSENWDMNTSENYKQFYMPFVLGKTGKGISNYFTYNLSDVANGNHFYINNSNTLLVFPHPNKSNEDIDTLNEWKQWLLQNPVTVYYQLATHKTINLPTTEPIRMWEGINNFELITNLEPSNMKIVYKKDINSIIKESGV